MITHVVLFKLKNYPDAKTKTEALHTFRSKLLALKDTIEVLRFIEVGLHHQLETDTFDLCLTTRFDSLDHLEIYKNHPEHQKVVGFVKEHAVQRAVVDYEL